MSGPISFVVPVAAVGVNRTYRVGRGRRVYKSEEANRYRDAVVMAARRAMRGLPRFDGDVAAEIRFAYATKRNDVDGAIKPTLDALNGIVWQDDRQVVLLTVSKAKHARPHVAVRVAVAPVDAPVNGWDAAEAAELSTPDTAGKDEEAPA